MAKTISSDELKKSKTNFVIIDVREVDELKVGHIDGSVHMPLGLVIRSANKSEIEQLKDKQICTYCRNGYRGNIAADELNKKGFSAVTLDGGFESWNE